MLHLLPAPSAAPQMSSSTSRPSVDSGVYLEALQPRPDRPPLTPVQLAAEDT